jgi:hypothetical protein
VPRTLSAWKDRYSVNPRDPTQTVGDYRTPGAQPIVVYYNKNELGLGRELGCGDWNPDDEGADPNDPSSWGIACWVTNYGATFGDVHTSLQEALLGRNAKNTVAIVYRPGLPAGYQVQFYVYDGNGDLQDWAQLDKMGPRKHPQVCTNCHGGTYDAGSHLVQGAHFLPLDPNTVAFSDTAAATDESLYQGGYTPAPDLSHWWSRNAQEEDIRRVNQIAHGTIVPWGGGAPLAHLVTQQLTSYQRLALDGLYAGGLDTPGQQALPPDRAWVPPNWSYDDTDRDVYTKVVKPYCITCHNAVSSPLSDAFQTPWILRTFPAVSDPSPASSLVYGFVCSSGAYLMPQAQITMDRFWAENPANQITVNGVAYASPAAARLATDYATAKADCQNYEDQSYCGFLSPTVCGDIHSGTACSGGVCTPNTTFQPTASELYPTGVCKLDGAFSCPKGQECRPAPGQFFPSDFGELDGACFTCGRASQPACTQGPRVPQVRRPPRPARVDRRPDPRLAPLHARRQRGRAVRLLQRMGR